MSNYYDGTKLLSLLDADGNKPEIYIVTTNRTGGKTTYFGRLCVNRFRDKGEKFALLYRFNYELDECADKFYKDIGELFFEGTTMKSVKRARGIFHELFLDGVSCGYAIALNGADQIKKYSHIFNDVQRIIFDEFQSETNHYCADEVKKFISVHSSIARGQGKQYRYVPVFMLGNPITILNPYYTEMGIASRLTASVKFLRGSGYVLEQGFVESAMLAQGKSGFNRAFSANNYISYSSQGIYLNDNQAFIAKPNGVGKYVATLKYNGCCYGIREFVDEGILYIDDKADMSFPVKISVTTQDHNINYVMLKRCDTFLNNLRYYFERGCFRFKDLQCKEALLKALSF